MLTHLLTNPTPYATRTVYALRYHRYLHRRCRLNEQRVPLTPSLQMQVIPVYHVLHRLLILANNLRLLYHLFSKREHLIHIPVCNIMNLRRVQCTTRARINAEMAEDAFAIVHIWICLLYTSPSPRD